MNQLSREFLKEIGKHHLVGLGDTGKGKSGFHRHLARAVIANLLEGMTFIDPHGEAARDTAAWCANPQHGIRRPVHVLKPGTDYSFSLNPFQTESDCPQQWHDAARQWASIVISCFHAQPGQLPRLERIQHVLGYIAAEKKLTLLDLPALISLGGKYLRDRVITGCSNPMVAAEWAGLAELAEKKPGQFFEQVESSLNRMLQWLTSPLLMRIYGRQQGLPARKIMDDREIVLIDLSALSELDASFVAKCIVSTYLTAAKRRVPHGSATHRLLIDECESSLCIETAKLLDQARKFSLFFNGNLQRLEQLRAREDGETIFDAVMSNCGAKVLMGMSNPESARYCAELFFTGHVNYAEEKPGTERPVAVGSERVIVRNRSRAVSHAEMESSGETDMRSVGTASASISASMFATGASVGSGENSSFSTTPPDTLLSPAPVTGHNDGRNNSQGSSLTRATSHGASTARQQTRAHARSHARAESKSTSCSEGESEAFITKYEWLPSFYTLEEQLHRLTGEIINLHARECFVKINEAKPYRTRTADLEPAFRSQEFQALMLPLYLENAARKSPYLTPCAEIDQEIAARFQESAQHTTPADPESWLEKTPAGVPALLAELKAHKDAQPHPAKPREPPQLRVVKDKSS